MAPSKVKGSAPKVRNANRAKGYWIALAKSRDNRDRTLVNRDPHGGINYPKLGDVGSAAHRRSRRT